jgi:hypothetical protein
MSTGIIMNIVKTFARLNRHTVIPLLGTVGGAGFGFVLAKLLLNPGPDSIILASWAGMFLSFALAAVLDHVARHTQGD